jgi:hypothetical protein
MRTPAQVELKLPGLDRGIQHRRIPVKEADLQRAIIAQLRAKGYEVLTTSRVRKRVRCSGCGSWSWPTGGDGVSLGLADLMVTHSRWRLPVWLGIEVKGSRTAISPIQKDFIDRGLNILARCVQDAVDGVEAADFALRA